MNCELSFLRVGNAAYSRACTLRLQASVIIIPITNIWHLNSPKAFLSKNLHLLWFSLVSLISRVSTGIPGYGLRTEMFSISIMEKVPERFFPLNRKFPGRCSGITERYGIEFRKIPVSETLVPEFSGKRFQKTLKTS